MTAGEVLAVVAALAVAMRWSPIAAPGRVTPLRATPAAEARSRSWDFVPDTGSTSPAVAVAAVAMRWSPIAAVVVDLVVAELAPLDLDALPGRGGGGRRARHQHPARAEVLAVVDALAAVAMRWSPIAARGASPLRGTPASGVRSWSRGFLR